MPSEPMQAVCSKEWKRRILLIALFIFGAASWFLFDGWIGYPQNNEKAEIYLPIKEELKGDEKALAEAWKKIAEPRGWNLSKPPKKIYSQQDLFTQFVFAGIGYLGVVATLFYYCWSLPRTLHYAEGQLTLPDKRVVDIKTIRNIDKRAWKSKGIARVRYESAPGQIEKCQLDDYKFIGTAEILEEIQKRLQPKSS